MNESANRFGHRARHPPPIPTQSEDSSDEYNVIDSDRQYERIRDHRGTSSGTPSSMSSNQGIIDPLIKPTSTMYFQKNLNKQQQQQQQQQLQPSQPPTATVRTLQHNAGLVTPTHYAESAIYHRNAHNHHLAEGQPQHHHHHPGASMQQATTAAAGEPIKSILEGNHWKTAPHSFEFTNPKGQQELATGTAKHRMQPSNTTIMSTLDSAANMSVVSGVGGGAQLNEHPLPLYDSSCLVRTASGSVYLPSDINRAYHHPGHHHHQLHQHQHHQQQQPHPAAQFQSLNELARKRSEHQLAGGGVVGNRHGPNSQFTTTTTTSSSSSSSSSTSTSSSGSSDNNCCPDSVPSPWRKMFNNINWKYVAFATMLVCMGLLIVLTFVLSTMANLPAGNNVNCAVINEEGNTPSLQHQPPPPQQSSSSSSSHHHHHHHQHHPPNKHLSPPVADTSSADAFRLNPFITENQGSARPMQFTDMHHGKRLYSQRIAPLGYWHLRLQQTESSLVRFNITFQSYLASAQVLAVYANQDRPATHTRYKFVEFLESETLQPHLLTKRRHPLAAADVQRPKKAVLNKEFTKLLTPGYWHFTIYNDALFFVDLSFELYSVPRETCPAFCGEHGNCVEGKCQCDVGFGGPNCDQLSCPVLCSGHGQYLKGECLCFAGWKGKECQVAEDECEVFNCNQHGECVEGVCRCFPGYSGEHCQKVDCVDPKCSGHGKCLAGLCVCSKGWKGSDCSEQVGGGGGGVGGGAGGGDAGQCQPQCNSHGVFDRQLNKCVCEDGWTGSNCAHERCDLDCGPNGHCEAGECACDEGWTGHECSTRTCDPRCSLQGTCANGTCTCNQGWNGRHCSLEGCPNECNGHGECVLGVARQWHCQCRAGFSGHDCGLLLEMNCDDNIDNDQDGLVDCADSECCHRPECEGKQLCFSASDPQDVLLRKQPPAITATFYQKMQFLIEDESVQSYADKAAFDERRASVIRGQIVDTGGQGIVGVRVGITNEPQFGFTLTRANGWFEMLVNGGGVVSLHLRRAPFRQHQAMLTVPLNEIVVLDKITLSLEEQLPDSLVMLSPNRKDVTTTTALHHCPAHDYERLRPIIVSDWRQHYPRQNHVNSSTVLLESQTVQETIPLFATDVHLVHHSSRANGFNSIVELQLTPDKIEATLKFVHLKITIEGILFDKTFEADPNLVYTYAWNRQNIYKQKVYGLANALVRVGYEYANCSGVIWETQTVIVAGYDMPISEVGGWNMNIHHRYNFHQGILHRGDGANINLKDMPGLLSTVIGDGQQRPLNCAYCNGTAREQRLLAPVALAAAADGSLFIGDFNLIRRLKPDGTITTIVELSESSVAHKYHLTMGTLDNKLYISDPEKHQILRTIDTEAPSDPRNNLEVVVGSGIKCLPGDRAGCGDNQAARDAKLSYPKGIAMTTSGELFIADGTNIRVVNKAGIIQTLIGDHYLKSHWKPIQCNGPAFINKLSLRWPTQLAISPIDGLLHILDDHVVLKLTHDRRLVVVAGRLPHCSGQKSLPDDNNVQHPLATQVYLKTPQDIDFAPNGDLYIVESDSQTTNRIRKVSNNDQRISLFAGSDLDCSCMEITCKCYSPDDILSTKSKFSTISSISVSPNGQIYVADLENVRIRSVMPSLPAANTSTGEYEIAWPETGEVYTFNQYGQHVSTKSALTGNQLYSFAYNINTINGKLNLISDAAGNKIFLLRDFNNQVKSIENSQGDKYRLTMNRQTLLGSFTTASNYAINFIYHKSPQELIQSTIDSVGKTTLYSYDGNGRVRRCIQPTGDILSFARQQDFDGLKNVIVTLNEKTQIGRFSFRNQEISKLITKNGEAQTIEQMSITFPDAKDVKSKTSFKQSDTSSLEIESISWPLFADIWPQSSRQAWSFPSTVRKVYNNEISRNLEWKYSFKKDKHLHDSIVKKFKMNGNTMFAMEYQPNLNQEVVLDQTNRPVLHISFDRAYRANKYVSSFNLTPVALDYDRLGRLVKWTRGALSMAYEYDLKGRVLSLTRGDSTVQSFKYSEATLKPLEMIMPSRSRYLFEYDGHGGLTKITTPGGHSLRAHRVNSLGFSKLSILPIGFVQPTVFEFNSVGKIQAKILPNNSGQKIYVYNANGHIRTELCGGQQTDYSYYQASDLLKAINRSHSNVFAYKVDYKYYGSLLKEEKYQFNAQADLSNYRLQYKYDRTGHVSEIELDIRGRNAELKKLRHSTATGIAEGINTFIFKRHSANVMQVGDEKALKTIATDSYGRPVGITLSVGNKEVFAQGLKYEASRSRISELKIKLGSKHLEQRLSYTLDGHLENIVADTVLSPQKVKTMKTKYIYDIDGNLNTFTGDQAHLTIRRDEAGRAKRFNEEDHDVFHIDDRGYVLTTQHNSRLIWNADGLLEKAIVKSQHDDLIISYQYDTRGRLLSRLVGNTAGARLNATQFIYDGSNANNPSYCLVDSKLIALYYDINGHLIALTMDNIKYYVASDHLGTPLAVFMADGTLVKEIVRNVWGDTISDSNPSFWLPIDYRNSIRDPHTKLNYFAQVGFYNPLIVQWMTPNWRLLSGAMVDLTHLYRFYNNDPINSIDSLRHIDGDLSHLPMTSIESWLSSVGYNMNYIFGETNKAVDSSLTMRSNLKRPLRHSTPYETPMTTRQATMLKEFNTLSIIRNNKLQEAMPSLLSIDDIGTQPSSLDGVVLSITTNKTIISSVGHDTNALVYTVFNTVFNNTQALPIKFISGRKDEYFFIRDLSATSISAEQQLHKDIEQLSKLSTLMNITRVGSTKAHQLLISTDQCLLNIRYGATFPQESARLIELSHAKAAEEAGRREIYYVNLGFPGHTRLDWTAAERANLMSNVMPREYAARYIHPPQHYPMLALDATNIQFVRR